MNYMLLSTDEHPIAGEGITRTADPGARLWPYRVMFPGNRPMRGSVLAASKRQAEQFLLARHPKALGVAVGARG
jgi:hypothetical protein